MTALFHRLTALSIVLAGGLALAAPAVADAPLVPAPVTNAANPYFGRWAVFGDREVFTARGKLYKTMDIAPCGQGFCGVSVDPAGRCGITLFRFGGGQNPTSGALRGRGRWGSETKNIALNNYEDGIPSRRTVELYLGDGHDFGGRSGSMPRFHGEYRRTGVARCIAR